MAYDACSDEDEEEDDDVEGTSPKQRQKKRRSEGDDTAPDAEVGIVNVELLVQWSHMVRFDRKNS